ncbi:Ribosome maturation factor RimP, partial [Ananas comosus]
MSADEIEGEEWMAEWEEEEEEEGGAEPAIGDGGDGGGVALGDVEWGEQALSVAREVLQLHFDDDLAMFAFKVSPRGYVYVRLDKLTKEFGCPAIEEIEKFNSLYKQRLDEMVERGEIPLDLAIEASYPPVSSPGAERLLKVPEDLDRFKEMPMRVQYMEEDPTSRHQQQKDGIFMLEVIDVETGRCAWKLADVKENRAEAGRGRPLSRKQKDWRISLPFDTIKR